MVSNTLKCTRLLEATNKGMRPPGDWLEVARGGWNELSQGSKKARGARSEESTHVLLAFSFQVNLFLTAFSSLGHFSKARLKVFLSDL